MKRKILSLGILGCAAFVIASGVRAESNAWKSDPEVEFGPWSAPVNLGPVVNSNVSDAGPAISRDGLSLYFHSARSGATDVLVSRRKAIDLPWEAPVNLGAIVNSDTFDGGPILSGNGHYLFFGSPRIGNFDILVSRRRHTHDDFAWEPPTALPPPVNGSSFDVPGALLKDEDGRTQFYFQSDRANGLGTAGLDIYVTELSKNGTWSDPLYVAELNSSFQEGRPTIRSDGLEVIFPSDRDGNLDLYVARRNHVWEPWSTPENLGPVLNTPTIETQPALSANGRTLYFASARPGGAGNNDLYVSTRLKLRTRD
jgi:hypothetical protein